MARTKENQAPEELPTDPEGNPVKLRGPRTQREKLLRVAELVGASVTDKMTDQQLEKAIREHTNPNAIRQQ